MNTLDNDVPKCKSAFISAASRKGWIVTAEGDWGIQLTRPKTYKESFLWIGAAFLIFGIGILIWIWGTLTI